MTSSLGCSGLPPKKLVKSTWLGGGVLLTLGVLFCGGVWIGDGDTSFFCTEGTTGSLPFATLNVGGGLFSTSFSTGFGETFGG